MLVVHCVDFVLKPVYGFVAKHLLPALFWTVRILWTRDTSTRHWTLQWIGRL